VLRARSLPLPSQPAFAPFILNAYVTFKQPTPPHLCSTIRAPTLITMGWRDDWPSMPDGSKDDGKQLGTLVRSGNSPFQGVWDVNLLIQEIEEHTHTQVTDIPVVDKGSNNHVSPCLSFPKNRA